MSENKDLAIKLFGKTIPLSLLEEASTRESSSGKPDDGLSSQQNCRSSGPSPPEKTSATEQGGQREKDEEFSGKVISTHTQQDDAIHQAIKDTKTPATTASDANENPEIHLSFIGNSSLDSKSAEQSETGTSQDKSMKKPDKILACPRCNSMDTKFCYYNNYNVNQPRHFCKKCQRYWTAGGTMRNVPIGSGRRKNKNASASHYRHLMVPQISPTAQLDVANGVHNGLLTFGSDTPLSDSLSSAWNLADKMNNVIRNDIHQLEQKAFVSRHGEDIGEDHSSGTSVTASCSTERRGHCGFQESVGNSYQAFPAQVPRIPGCPWPHAMKSTKWSPTLPPASFPPPIPVSFYPAPAYWGCTLPSPWNVTFISPSSSSANQRASCPGPNSSTLGKHSRDEDILSTSKLKKEEPTKVGGNEETSVLVPKTLRIDDPTEAAKSSIREALGNKNEKANCTHVRSLFKGFKTEGKGKNHVVEPSALLQVNPAAFCRSLSFHEST